ncbi:MAG: response regulator [Spirochaetales bacterium]|nr:response regulator [Spirochaetales bacterium]
MEKLKILAIDDEIGVLKIIKKICNNYDVTTETTSLRAIEMIKKEKFDIIIVDYQLPCINGIELLEEIKEEYDNSEYVSIFCTAYGTIHLFKEEICKGLFSFFIEKPFEIEVFKEILRKAILHLERKRIYAKLQISNN